MQSTTTNAAAGDAFTTKDGYAIKMPTYFRSMDQQPATRDDAARTLVRNTMWPVPHAEAAVDRQLVLKRADACATRHDHTINGSTIVGLCHGRSCKPTLERSASGSRSCREYFRPQGEPSLHGVLTDAFERVICWSQAPHAAKGGARTSRKPVVKCGVRKCGRPS